MPSERTHHISQDDLSALLDSELRADAKARCDEHLSACVECRAARDGLTAVRSSLRALPHARARRSFVVRESDVPAKRASLLVQAMPMLSGAMVLAAITFLGLLSVDLGVGASNSSKNSTSSYAPALQSSGSVEKRLTNGGSATSLSPQHNADVPAPPSATGSQYAAPSAADQAEGRSPATQGAPFADPVPTAPAATQALRRVSSDESARHTGLRIAEAVAAALALASGGLAVAAWRRSG